jgi:hypothetical protein
MIRTHSTKSKLLFIHHGMTRFVRNDFETLQKRFEIYDFYYHALKSPFDQIRDQLLLFFWLCRHIWDSHYIFIWFADYHSFLPVLFGKIFKRKSFLALGGYDVASVPELDYGSYKNKIRASLTTFSLKYASYVLPVADNLEAEAQQRVPDATVKVLYTGFDAQKFNHNGEEKKSQILTVGAGNTQQRIKLKGIDFFVKLADSLTNFHFIIAGLGEDARLSLRDVPENVQILGHVSDDQLLALYRESKIYAQFSMREGLPSAVCEAMLCECIPIGFNNGGISIAIGDCGFVIENGDMKAAHRVITKSMAMDSELGKKARQRIIKNFSIQRREKSLFALMMNEQINT